VNCLKEKFIQEKERFKGPIAYPTTPFKISKGKLIIDEESFRKQIRFLIEHNVPVITPCGGTGEFFSLNVDEWKNLIKISVEEAKGKDIIIMPSVGGGINQAIEMSQYAQEKGCTILQLTMLDPMFGLTEEGIYEYNRVIADSVSIMVMSYKTGTIPMSLETATKICEIENVQAFKDEAGDVTWFRDLMIQTNWEIIGVCGGGEEKAPYYLLAGAKAYTTGVINLIPHLSISLFKAAIEAKWDEVFKIQEKLKPLNRIRSKPGKMIPVIKEALKLLNITDNVNSRPPIVPLTTEEKVMVKSTLKNLDLLD